MQGFRGFIAVAAVLALGACAPAAEQSASPTPARRHTSLLVKNDNWNDVKVYIVSGSTRTRLGSVTAMSRGQFYIPDAYVLGASDVTIEADPVGSNDSYLSPPIQVFPGAQVALTVGNSLRLSNFAVYATR
jgi:hypothetical protein